MFGFGSTRLRELLKDIREQQPQYTTCDITKRVVLFKLRDGRPTRIAVDAVFRTEQVSPEITAIISHGGETVQVRATFVEVDNLLWPQPPKT